MSDYITLDEFKTIYLPSRVKMEADDNLRKWCRKWDVSYVYAWRILHGKSPSVSEDFMSKIDCQYKVQIP
jgi:hypothetical protein